MIHRSCLALAWLSLIVHMRAFSLPSVPRNHHRLSVGLPTSPHLKTEFAFPRHGRNDIGSLALAAVNGGESEPLGFPAKLKAFANKNFFLIGMFVAVISARLFPALGKNGGLLRAEFFIGKFGVAAIFLLSGLSLELSELKDAVANLKLNAAIQVILFGIWPYLIGLPLTKFLGSCFPNFLTPPLLDGFLITSCLPTTVNMCVVLTTAAGGNVATSICNAVISNVAGIFLTPALLLRFYGAHIELPFASMVLKLCNKVLLPVAVGQALRATNLKEFSQKHSKSFKRIQEVILLSILWNAFCDAFIKGLGMGLNHAVNLIGMIAILHGVCLTGLFSLFALPIWKLRRREVVAAAFCASHKTLAFGLPLIKTVFEGSANVASYCAPLMVIHPLQVIIGSILVPRFSRYIEGESES